MSDHLTWNNERRRLRDLVAWEHNPRYIRREEAERLAQSLDEFGQIQTIAIDPDNGILDGHQRQRVWAALDRYGPDYEVDVRVASRPLTEQERQRLVILLHQGTVGVWDWDMLANVFDTPSLLEWGFSEESLGLVLGPTIIERDDQIESIERARRDERLSSVDLIFTASSGIDAIHYMCCLAMKSGWLYGFQSSGSPCLLSYHMPAHRPVFIDNEFKNYDHARHLEAVQQWQPRYCTVRDVMTRQQCDDLGTEHYSLDQILKWAEELQQHAENVIVIPKYDCLQDIPEQYMLGYSVPTSYAGTPLPIEMFAGRRVHLLGGSPRVQIAFWNKLPDDVVSLDNNYIVKAAKYGQFWSADGQTYSLSDIGIGPVSNPMYIALALSLGGIKAYFRQPGLSEAQIEIDGVPDGNESDEDRV